VQLGAFRDEVLPQLVQRAERTRMPVRIWSAGCSSGEEAYTLAILLEESGHFSSAPAAVQFEVIGTDIAEGEIVRGRAGVYGPKSFRAEIEPTVRRRYFVDDGNSVHVHPSLRARVRFECMNLLESGSLPRFDAIFCRNVLIYMGKAARARVVERFYERLVPGGVLFLGHSESLLHVETPFRLLPLSRELAYRRSDVAPGDERPRPPRSRP
jgi:chemotaxis protein methyltransferase CheR